MGITVDVAGAEGGTVAWKRAVFNESRNHIKSFEKMYRFYH